MVTGSGKCLYQKESRTSFWVLRRTDACRMRTPQENNNMKVCIKKKGDIVKPSFTGGKKPTNFWTKKSETPNFWVIYIKDTRSTHPHLHVHSTEEITALALQRRGPYCHNKCKSNGCCRTGRSITVTTNKAQAWLLPKRWRWGGRSLCSEVLGDRTPEMEKQNFVLQSTSVILTKIN